MVLHVLFRENEDAMFWLEDAMITDMCYNSTEPSIRLMLNMDRMTPKCYTLFDKLECNKGMIIENIVAQMLTATGHKLYFYSNPSRESSEDRMEIDFLIAKSK